MVNGRSIFMSIISKYLDWRKSAKERNERMYEDFIIYNPLTGTFKKVRTFAGASLTVERELEVLQALRAFRPLSPLEEVKISCLESFQSSFSAAQKVSIPADKNGNTPEAVAFREEKISLDSEHH